MTNKHCSEEELQRCAAGQPIPDPEWIEHIKTCSSCSQQVTAYRLIIAAIREQPAIAFDFDLEAAVLEQLQPAKKRALSNRFYTIMIAVFIALFTIVSLYIFRKNFLVLSAAVSAGFLGISVITCVSIIGFKLVRLYRRYNLQIKKLNFSE